MTLAGAEPGVITVMELDEKQEERMFHRMRRGVGGRPLNFYELADHATEQMVSHTVEKPWYLEACMRSATCQRICFPAEYATRKRKIDLSTSAHVMTATGELVANREGVLGLPRWNSSGYELALDQQGAQCDQQVSTVLGLHKAVHRSSSTERFCYTCAKNLMPPGVDRKMLVDHLHHLQSLDHVNILRCHEVYEDDDMLYLMYEFFPCISLASVIEQIMWTQKQQVNLVRECVAAVAHACHVGISHLGWTHWHVLLPASAWNSQPDLEGAKVFGFGLNGLLHADTNVLMFWAPEAIQHQQKYNTSFALRMPTSWKMSCDCWSLGALAYTVIARRPPFIGPSRDVTERILHGRWDFNVAFNLVGMEAKTLVEGLMNFNFEQRMTAAAALRSEWIRRHASYDARLAARLFAEAEEFVSSSLPKRLFGRFLVKHLDADHFRKIMRVLYALDFNGDGKLCLKDLKMAANHAGRPNSETESVFSWFVSDCSAASQAISLSCFAESMAEVVIDGKAMRHAFESLDDDGSECISAVELYDALGQLDSRLTYEEVVSHIELAEKDVGGEGNAGGDHMIDFTEFCALFPVRIQRLKKLEDRRKLVQAQGVRLDGQLSGLAPQATEWTSILQEQLDHLNTVMATEIDKDRLQAVKAIKNHFRRIAKALRSPPGPGDTNKLLYRITKMSHKRQKGQRFKHGEDLYGYDSFIQDRAVEETWTHLVNSELKELERGVVTKDEDGKPQVDHFRALDLAERVVQKAERVLSWTAAQHQEYTSMVEVLDTALEDPMHALPYSSRGLRQQAETTRWQNEPNYMQQDKSSALADFCTCFHGGDIMDFKSMLSLH